MSFWFGGPIWLAARPATGEELVLVRFWGYKQFRRLLRVAVMFTEDMDE